MYDLVKKNNCPEALVVIIGGWRRGGWYVMGGSIIISYKTCISVIESNSILQAYCFVPTAYKNPTSG